MSESVGVEGYRPMETSFLSNADDNTAISGQPHALTNDRARVGTSSDGCKCIFRRLLIRCGLRD